MVNIIYNKLIFLVFYYYYRIICIMKFFLKTLINKSLFNDIWKTYSFIEDNPNYSFNFFEKQIIKKKLFNFNNLENIEYYLSIVNIFNKNEQKKIIEKFLNNLFINTDSNYHSNYFNYNITDSISEKKLLLLYEYISNKIDIIDFITYNLFNNIKKNTFYKTDAKKEIINLFTYNIKLINKLLEIDLQNNSYKKGKLLILKSVYEKIHYNNIEFLNRYRINNISYNKNKVNQFFETNHMVYLVDQHIKKIENEISKSNNNNFLDLSKFTLNDIQIKEIEKINFLIKELDNKLNNIEKLNDDQKLGKEKLKQLVNIINNNELYDNKTTITDLIFDIQESLKKINELINNHEDQEDILTKIKILKNSF